MDQVTTVKVEDFTIIIRISDQVAQSVVVAYHCRRCHRTSKAEEGQPPKRCKHCYQRHYHLIAANAEPDPNCDMCDLIIAVHGGVKRAQYGRPKGK